jgi:hypothetical protein
LHAVPASARSAVTRPPSSTTLLAAYPGQASSFPACLVTKSAEEEEARAAAPKSAEPNKTDPLPNILQAVKAKGVLYLEPWGEGYIDFIHPRCRPPRTDMAHRHAHVWFPSEDRHSAVPRPLKLPRAHQASLPAVSHVIHASWRCEVDQETGSSAGLPCANV